MTDLSTLADKIERARFSVGLLAFGIIAGRSGREALTAALDDALRSRAKAGGKPYVSEGLPTHNLQTTIGEVLDAFTEGQIRAALREKKRRRDYFADYHAWKRGREAAQAIEAASADETAKTGSAEGESPVPKGCAHPSEGAQSQGTTP